MRRGLLLLVLIAQAAAAYGWERTAPPYPLGKFPDNCPVHLLKPVQETDRSKGGYRASFRVPDKKQPLQLQLKMDYSENKFGLYASLAKAGKQALGPFRITDHPSYLGQVFWGYLNKDEHKDLIINTLNGDRNLTGARYASWFLLSTPYGGYQLYQLGNYALEADDFYDYTRDDKCEYLHLAFVSDRKSHYWVYNVLQFNESGIVIRNKLSRYFPRWIPFSEATAKQPLTAKKRQRLWNQHLQGKPFARRVQ